MQKGNKKETNKDRAERNKTEQNRAEGRRTSSHPEYQRRQGEEMARGALGFRQTRPLNLPGPPTLQSHLLRGRQVRSQDRAKTSLTAQLQQEAQGIEKQPEALDMMCKKKL